jgi:hypothetical protein
MNLTERDLDLLETLTLRVPMLTVPQTAEVWWPKTCHQRAARHRLALLARSGWIERHIINAHPPLATLHPLFSWMPGEQDPDGEHIACESRARWSQPTRPTEVYVASPRTACVLGSTARGLPPLEHRDHDLRLAAVYVHYRKSHPRLASSWISQHALPKAGYRLKDPDALLRHANGRVLRVIQAAGRWNAAQVASFHEYCIQSDLPYELW